jgi:DNA mismatch endonuclease Vsr
MTDNLSPEDRRRTMRAVKSKNSSLERSLCSMLAGMGLGGWRKNAVGIAGNPDVVFGHRLAIFADGCFWHGCPTCRCKLPTTNRDYWERKISRNLKRAAMVDLLLAQEGWRVIRIWEHEMKDTGTRAKIRRRRTVSCAEEPECNARRIRTV